MLCLNGLVKITDFGLAAFSRKQDTDPWCLDRDMAFGLKLCAQLEGFTITYTSPQQRCLQGWEGHQSGLVELPAHIWPTSQSSKA